jgi:hypothetical protein
VPAAMLDNSGFVINGDKLEDFSGFSVSSAGDVNGDGLSDLIVGTFAAGINGIGTYEGKSYVVFGKNNNQQHLCHPSFQIHRKLYLRYFYQ